MRRIALVIATTFGAGYVPGAPGTMGSAVGAAAAWALHRAGGWIAVAIATVVLLPISIWAAGEAERHYGEHDCQHIVIDEVVGQLIALVATPCDWLTVAVGFGFFRLCDSLKPFPAGWIDREVKGGFGVILDDVAAGVQAAALTAALVYTGLLGWVALRLHLPI
jgi:phosphatidylglycerophosphatase A